MAFIDPQSTAIICIDMQKDFLLEHSPLCVKGGLAIVRDVISALDKARENAIQVFYVIREHDPNGMDIEWTRRHLLPEGPSESTSLSGATLPGSEGVQMIEGLEVKGTDRVLIKKRFSAFFLATHLDIVLRRLGIKHLIPCGVQTPNCVRATAVDAIALDYRVTVLSDATASKSEEVQRSNLEDMLAMGVKIEPTEECFASIARATKGPPSLLQSSLKAFAATLT